MVTLLLLASLAQVPLVPGYDEAAPSPAPADSRHASAEVLQREADAKVVRRALLSGAAGVAGSAVGLGIALVFTLPNPSFDARFATSALCALMVTGGAFLVHQGLGGHGEVMLALLGSIVSMVGATLIANAVDPTVPMAPILTAAIGALPGAVLAVVGLEGTSPRRRAPLTLAAGPGAISVSF
jgi:hypothetical protein